MYVLDLCVGTVDTRRDPRGILHRRTHMGSLPTHTQSPVA
jgi:hypothetical protein